MPAISNPQLDTVIIDNDVTLTVTYVAGFTTLERHLAEHGLSFQERLVVVADAPTGGPDPALAQFPLQQIPATSGSVARTRTLTVSRSVLNEDPQPGNNDEIHVRIEIVPIGMPVQANGFTETKVLFG
jgi:hypothetical protein